MYILLFFVVMVAIRGLLLVVSYPLLGKLGHGTSPKDSAFMVWAGLRGAVGLALAQFVLQSGGNARAGKELQVCVSSF